MSIDAMKQALAALNDYEPNEAHKVATALRAAIEQAQGLAEKIPAKGTVLEQTLRRVWDEMPHTALMDALIGGTGVMLGDKRIDPASIYKQPEQEPMSIIQQLWDIIDDIDTYTDMAKADDKWYRLLVERRQKDRWKTGITTDGQTLNVPLYTAPRQWQGLTEEDVKAPIQRAMQHFGFDPTQYSLGGMATIGFLGLVKEIEAKLREKNRD